MYVKSIIDQIVSSKILPDDNLEFIDKVSFSGETGAKKARCIVTGKQIGRAHV